ncbi:hypothetical protein STEG23_022939, partial [Scotinomys teguina]
NLKYTYPRFCALRVMKSSFFKIFPLNVRKERGHRVHGFPLKSSEMLTQMASCIIKIRNTLLPFETVLGLPYGWHVSTPSHSDASSSGHTGRLLQSLCLTSLSFLLLHIIFHITLASLEAQHRIAPAYN